MLSQAVKAQALGKPRWAWLEIDGRTYEAVSVFDTGERGADYVLGMIANKDAEAFVGAYVGVDCATWAVTAYSLSLDDYDDILTNAKLLCGEILSHLEEVMALTGGPTDYVMSKVKDKIKKTIDETKRGAGMRVGKKPFSLMRIRKILKDKKGISKGFVQGFNLAVEAYFDLE